MIRAGARLALIALCAGSGCAQGAPAGGSSAAEALAAADTLRGRVEVVGAEPATSIVLLGPGTGAVMLIGEAVAMRPLAGLEVVVSGEAEGARGFRVERFAVRAHMGVPAVDGVLGREGESWFLRLEGGERRPLPRLPEALRGREGARVWIAGPLDAPDAFGVIE